MIAKYRRGMVGMGLAVFALTATAANALTTMHYSGRTFDSFSTYLSNPYTVLDRITGTVVLTAPIAPNSFFYGSPLSFSFSDGVQTLTNLTSFANGFSFETDGNGDVVKWGFDIERLAGPGYIYSSRTSNGSVDHGNFESESGYTYNVDPNWTITATADVPEPASWALLVAGFGLTGAVMRRRRVAAVA
jgi:hypothetical protein